MKQTRKKLVRLLSAGMSLALLAGLLPSAFAARARAYLEYEVDSDEVLEIRSRDLNRLCEDETGDGLDFVLFTDLPSSSEGKLYYADKSESEVKVDDDEEIYYKNLSYLIFKPNEDFDGSITIPFEYENDADLKTYTAELRIEVNGGSSSSSSKGDLTYEIDVNDVLELDSQDFDDYVYNETKEGKSVRKLWFTDLPSSSKGILYYDYDKRGEYEVEEDETFDSDDIDQLTFVPEEDWEGTVTLYFEGQSDKREDFSGKLVIEVNGDKDDDDDVEGDVTYDVDVNDTVDLRYRDFSNYSYDEVDDDVSYIWFTDLPSHREGTIYYRYDKWDEEEAEETTAYDYDQMDELTFVPAEDFEGTVTVGFKGKADNGKSFSGDLVFRVGDVADADFTVKLQAGTGAALTFRADDFNNACLKETGSNLNYISFDFESSSRDGQLYYQYGQSGESEVGDERYYRNSYPQLSDVSFIPGRNTDDTATIPFTGQAANGDTFKGEVEIEYVSLRAPSVINYTTSGLAVKFKGSDFTAACKTRGGGDLVSVKFMQPSNSNGKLYYSYTSPAQYRGPVVAGIDYSVNGVYQLSEISFLPKAGYVGTVNIPYVGTDEDGITYNGTVSIQVSSVTTSRFTDMANYGWATPSVEFMASYGITTGTGTGKTYSPAWAITRGDYILMLCRTFGLTTTQTANFTDVPAGTYYTQALATAKALGIATGDSKGAFHPTQPVTRQDAMVFLYKAMQAAKRDVPSANPNVLNQFSDASAIAADARTAVAAMVQAGVIQGTGGGKISPNNTLTRAEMATILHRAVTL